MIRIRHSKTYFLHDKVNFKRTLEYQSAFSPGSTLSLKGENYCDLKLSQLCPLINTAQPWGLYFFVMFFFFYGGSLMDVASQTAWQNSPLTSACLPASTVETPIHSPMSCVHLLLGLPLPLLPSHVPSKNSFSNVLCPLMWPKYDSFCFLIRFKSCGAFTPSCFVMLGL